MSDQEDILLPVEERPVVPEEVETGPPPSFDWNTAHDLLHRHGHHFALALGLSMVSEQLDYIAQRMGDKS